MLLKLNIFIFMLSVCKAFENLGTDKEKLDFKTTKLYFDDFIQTYNKNYEDDTEYQRRHDIFVDNLMKINKRNSNGNKTFGITEFTDLKHEEFLKKHTCLKKRKIYSNTDVEDFLSDRNIRRSIELPTDFSWVDKGYVSSVKSQSPCGSCWTFSTMGTIEGQVAKKHNKLYNLSEQQLIDCVGDRDCNTGGDPIDAFEYLAEMGGVLTEEDYPYVGKKQPCHIDVYKAVAKVISGMRIATKDEDELKKLLHVYGPISVDMQVLDDFVSYKGGVYVPTLDCNSQEPNHALLLVGYGYDYGVPYWLVKNSWGTSWGKRGFGKIIRGHNACSIASYAAIAKVQ